MGYLALGLLLFLGAGSTGVKGDWIGPTGSVVRVYDCADAVCLKIVKLPANAPATNDGHNPDAALRTRTLCGADIGTAFHAVDADHLDGGRLYDPTSGKTYKGSIAAEGDKLKLHGYVGVSLFGRTETWKRVAAVEACK